MQLQAKLYAEQLLCYEKKAKKSIQIACQGTRVSCRCNGIDMTVLILTTYWVQYTHAMPATACYLL